MKALIWKTYYKFKLGENYSKTLNKANSLVNSIAGSTEGRISHFYNDRGDKIRGWGGKRYTFTKEQHPLVTRYGN